MGRLSPSSLGQRTLRRATTGALLTAACALAVHPAAAEPYPEPIVQWGVRAGDTCEDVSRAVYGSPAFTHLVRRYNRVACVRGAPLREGLTLVLPASATALPTARVDSLNPAVQARPPGGGWSEAGVGTPLTSHAQLETKQTGRAGVRFVDRSRIGLAENTLVVVYDTASETSVARVQPQLEVERGEVKAALAALRGETVPLDVAVAGGQVGARSRDTVIQKRGERATIAVFEGEASVTSAGKRVVVPTLHGSRFERGKAPLPPRPLPAAPALLAAPAALSLALDGASRFELAWEAVPRAVRYRVEVARDADFDEVLVREEVGADVRRFRAEAFPTGAYHLRVRAIDDEEFLGVASAATEARVVRASTATGSIALREGVLHASPDATISFEGAEGLTLAAASGSLPAPGAPLALQGLAGGALTVRLAGATLTVPVHVAAPPVVAPPPAPPEPDPEPAPVPAPTPPRLSLGPAFFPIASTARVDARPYAPTAQNAAGLGVSARGESGEARITGWVFVGGAWGPASFEAAARTSDQEGGVTEGGTAWLGARVRVFEAAGWQLAPSLRVGVPTLAGVRTRLDAGVALGHVTPGYGLWIDAGARPRLGDHAPGSPDALDAYAIVGAHADWLDPVRLHASLDPHALVNDARDTTVYPAGALTLGAELAASFFRVGVATRVTPFTRIEPGVVSGQLVIGVAEP